MRTDQVFGIAPDVREHSYVDRGNLDEALATALGRSTHVAVRGPSKSGKSWLRQKVLREPIVVQCRLRKPFTDIYVDALSQLGIYLQIKETRQGTFKASLTAASELGRMLLAQVALSGSMGFEKASSQELRPVGHDVHDLKFIADIIKASGRRLVVEDFHYMSTDDRRNLAFDLKSLWDYSVFVVIIGVWSETNLLLHLNPDLSGRVVEVSIDWSSADLRRILIKGGAALSIEFSLDVRDELVALSYANAGLLQQLALLTLDDAGIKESAPTVRHINRREHVQTASMVYAEQLNPLYQQFAKRLTAGIRSRKNATGIYAHMMAAIMEASDVELIGGLHARVVFDRAYKRQPRILYGNLKAVLEKMPGLQVDEDGRGLILGYSPATEEVTIVDRQLLLYRRFATLRWPWEDLIKEADAAGGLVESN